METRTPKGTCDCGNVAYIIKAKYPCCDRCAGITFNVRKDIEGRKEKTVIGTLPSSKEMRNKPIPGINPDWRKKSR